MDNHCAALLASSTAPTTSPSAATSQLASEILQAYVLLISGHFQGFCRDLYTECAQLCAATVPPGLRITAQAQFAAELALNTKNPTVENIRKDFERFDLQLDLAATPPADQVSVTQLGHLNYWRNHVAHQKATPPPQGVPAVLTLGDVHAWAASCDRLAAALDGKMSTELTRILGAPPW